jgi:hypothetical protein
MKDIKIFDLYQDIINGISSKFNKKALKHVLEYEKENIISHYQDDKYNDILRLYYLKSRYQDLHDPNFQVYINIQDEKDLQDLKQDYRIKRYKTKYNYDKDALQPIKQKNTGLLIEYCNGFTTYFSYGFDVYQYIAFNNYNVIE